MLPLIKNCSLGTRSLNFIFTDNSIDQLHVFNFNLIYENLFFQGATKHAKFARDLIREVVGFAPYEKRVQELFEISKDKRALKFASKLVSILVN